MELQQQLLLTEHFVYFFRMLKDHSDVSGIHGQALDSLRLKLTEVEGQLQREEEAHKRTEVLYNNMIVVDLMKTKNFLKKFCHYTLC